MKDNIFEKSLTAVASISALAAVRAALLLLAAPVAPAAPFDAILFCGKESFSDSVSFTRAEPKLLMILETFLVLGVLFVLGILFYRQAIEEYSWSQIEFDQISELPKLLGERKPVVVRSVGEPKLYTPEVLRGNSRLQAFPLISGTTLGAFLESGDRATLNHPLSEPVRRALAQESGLQVWAEHTWFSRLLPVSWLEFFYKLHTHAHIGKEGLTKTTARTTVIYPTSGKLEVTLLNEAKGKLFPNSWKGRFPETFTIQDTPLVGEIKYITIVVRPGSVLCIPPHWYISVSCPPNAFWATFELHDPFSLLAHSLQ